jgi:hypothetical protein
MCLNSHDVCRPKNQGRLPQRVLDVGASESDTCYLKVDPGITADYATLSYRWGHSQTLTTTKSTLDSRISGISSNSLPRTIKDALIITRHLGLRYLWIDALCIIQDSAKDWEEQSSKMGQIYANAYINISAGSASDTQSGFLNRRELRTIRSCKHPSLLDSRPRVICPNIPWPEKIMNKDILNSRGWILQEQVLSRRIINFGPHEVYWECLALSASEREPEDLTRIGLDSFDADSQNRAKAWIALRRGFHFLLNTSALDLLKLGGNNWLLEARESEAFEDWVLRNLAGQPRIVRQVIRGKPLDNAPTPAYIDNPPWIAWPDSESFDSGSECRVTDTDTDADSQADSEADSESDSDQDLKYSNPLARALKVALSPLQGLIIFVCLIVFLFDRIAPTRWAKSLSKLHQRKPQLSDEIVPSKEETEHSEENPLSIDHLPTYRRVLKVIPNTRSPEESRLIATHHLWYMLVQDYSRRFLTVSSDKLPALSGLAGYFSEALGSNTQYVAGIWGSDIITGLCWERRSDSQRRPYLPQPSQARNQVTYRAPSFSWVSIDDPFYVHSDREEVLTGQTLTASFEAQVLSAHTTLAGLDRFGQVSRGHIRLRAFIVRFDAIKSVYRENLPPIFDQHTDTNANLFLNDPYLMCACIRRREYNSVNPSLLNGELKYCLILLPAPTSSLNSDKFGACEEPKSRDGRPEYQQHIFRRVGFWCVHLVLPMEGPCGCPDDDVCKHNMAALGKKLDMLFPRTEEQVNRDKRRKAAVGFSGWEEKEIIII